MLKWGQSSMLHIWVMHLGWFCCYTHDTSGVDFRHLLYLVNYCLHKQEYKKKYSFIIYSC